MGGSSGAGECDDGCDWQDAHGGKRAIGLNADVALVRELVGHEMIPP